MQLVVLKSENRTHIGKSYRGIGDSGQINIPSRYFAYPAQAQNIDEFSQLALDMEANHPDATLILGQLTEQAQNKEGSADKSQSSIMPCKDDPKNTESEPQTLKRVSNLRNWLLDKTVEQSHHTVFSGLQSQSSTSTQRTK